MLALFLLFTLVIALIVLGGPQLVLDSDSDDWNGECEGDVGSSCNPSFYSSNSCCFRNPIIASQIRDIESHSGRLCEGPDTTDCLCLPNIASMYVGASIATTRKTTNYNHPEGLPTSQISNKPELIIETSPITPGLNWHFVGTGTVVVKLFNPAEISGITLIHPPICRIPKGLETSAPKNFSVLGLHQLDEKDPFLFGNFTYDVYKGQSAQTFPVQSCSMDKFQYVEFRILGNHGNPNYTALYKIQIHGDMSLTSVPPSKDTDDDGEED